MVTAHISKLFEPIQIGHFSVNNRLVMPAMLTGFATGDGFVTDRMVSYYSRRAEGGVGLVIIEGTCVDDPIGRVRPYQLCIDDDKYLQGLRELTKAVHSYGGRAAIQLHHAGPTKYFEGRYQPVAPSPIPLMHTPHIIPRQLDQREIKEIIAKFASAARRAKQAGFDAVELLCAHGYLLNRFLSPHANRRQDEYGGAREGRARILREIIRSIRVEAGRDLSILCKVPGNDYVDGGITPEESSAICKILEGWGVDALTVTAGSAEGRFNQSGMGCPSGWLVHLAEKAKQNVRIPVIAIGRIKDPEFAETILNEGKADLVAIGRGLIAEPDFVAKAQRKESDRIIPCITCNHCLDRVGFEQSTVRCSVNPVTGREYETRVVPADRPRKIFVVGGGPAGMQTASVAASRGHQVALYEKSDKLGGQLLLAAISPDKDEIRRFTHYLSGQLKELGVEIRLNIKVTRQVVDTWNPEVVVLATGASPLIPPIPGVDLEKVITAWDALFDPGKVDKNVVVVGGGMVGCEVARFLSHHGKKVTIVEQLEEVGLDIGPSVRKFEIGAIEQMGVIIMRKAPAKQITKDGVVVDDNGKLKLINAGTVVLAVGSRSNREMLEALETAKAEVHVIGDSVAPRRIVQAISQGFRIGCYL
jgi:2,4-dienoyl-CoA reductase-like NADH-dependent reductase (Old Yellow Enzyme family)/thioredoxin reductase